VLMIVDHCCRETFSIAYMCANFIVTLLFEIFKIKWFWGSVKQRSRFGML